MRSSDALVVFGSDDPGYTASKIYPFVLSQRPLLAIFHQKSSVVSLLNDVKGGVCVAYTEHTTPEMLAEHIYQAWFRERTYRAPVALDHLRFAPYTAREQAIAIGEWFRTIVASQRMRCVHG